MVICLWRWMYDSEHCLMNSPNLWIQNTCSPVPTEWSSLSRKVILMESGSWRHGSLSTPMSGPRIISKSCWFLDSFTKGVAAFLSGIEKSEDAILLDLMSDLERRQERESLIDTYLQQSRWKQKKSGYLEFHSFIVHLGFLAKFWRCEGIVWWFRSHSEGSSGSLSIVSRVHGRYWSLYGRNRSECGSVRFAICLFWGGGLSLGNGMAQESGFEWVVTSL